MKLSHFKKQFRLAGLATVFGFTMMWPAFMACSVRQLGLSHFLPESWGFGLILAQVALLAFTPFWALKMARGFLASPSAKQYRDELHADGERVLRERLKQG